MKPMLSRKPLTRTATFSTDAKPRKCRHCKVRLESFGEVIHPECVDHWYEANRVKLAAKAARAKAKAERESFKARKEAIKSPRQREAKCRSIAQKLARLRDRNDGCISCHMGPDYQGQWHGSHFRSVGACSALQLNLWNIHKSCAQCNLHKSGNIAAYRPRLIAKIGADRVEWLESQNQVVRRDVDYLIKYERVMGKRLRRLEKRLKESA